VLRTPAEPVRDFDAELRRLVKDLTETMLDAPGAGLAAPLAIAALNTSNFSPIRYEKNFCVSVPTMLGPSPCTTMRTA